MTKQLPALPNGKSYALRPDGSLEEISFVPAGRTAHEAPAFSTVHVHVRETSVVQSNDPAAYYNHMYNGGTPYSQAPTPAPGLQKRQRKVLSLGTGTIAVWACAIQLAIVIYLLAGPGQRPAFVRDLKEAIGQATGSHSFPFVDYSFGSRAMEVLSADDASSAAGAGKHGKRHKHRGSNKAHHIATNPLQQFLWPQDKHMVPPPPPSVPSTLIVPPPPVAYSLNAPGAAAAAVPMQQPQTPATHSAIKREPEPAAAHSPAAPKTQASAASFPGANIDSVPPFHSEQEEQAASQPRVAVQDASASEPVAQPVMPIDLAPPAAPQAQAAAEIDPAPATRHRQQKRPPIRSVMNGTRKRIIADR